MKEIPKKSEVESEQSRLKNIAERMSAKGENFSVAQADQKLEERLGIGAPIESSNDENFDKKVASMKKEITEVFAERYNTSPEFEELRSKNKINRLTTLEKARYAYLSYKYPERAKISPEEQRRTNVDYAESKKNKIDFQIVEAFRFFATESKDAKVRGTSLSPRDSDCFDKLSVIYSEKLSKEANETIRRVEDRLRFI